MFINYAHRGASAYAPENTFSAFYLGLEMGANGIETDVRRTKDGQLVLFHDDVLEHTTDMKGTIGQYALADLKHILIYGKRGFTPDRIVTLDEFMYRFGYRSLAFALEIKDEGVEEDTLHTVKAYGAEEKCIFTSFCYTSLMRIRRLDPHAHLGYLVKSVSEQVIREAKAIQCEQLCPHVSSLNQETVRQLKEMGFSIRAWGISDETVMKQCLSYGVDGGMTINFPDKLTKALGETLC